MNTMNNKVRKARTQKGRHVQKKMTQKIDVKDNRMLIWGGLTVVFLTTFAIYFNAIKFDLLLWDDGAYITINQDIMRITWENIKVFFSNYYINNYHPLTMLFFALDYNLGSGGASLFHFNNILLHLINTLLVFVLVKKISPESSLVALITAAFFAIHPMHVESVAWIAERKDVLYTLFFLLSLIMYLDYLKNNKIKYLFFSGIFFVISCLSKSAAVILPLILFLFDYYFSRKYSWRMFLEKIPFLAISLVFGIVALYSQQGAMDIMAPHISINEQISIVSYSFINYIFKAFVPINLSALYPYPMELGGTLPVVYYISILFVIVVLFFVWYSRRWGKDVIFGFLFFIITIILVLQFIQVGSAIMADRYTYVPYIGIFFIVGKLFEYLYYKTKKTNKTLLLMILTVLFIVFSAICYHRVQVWKNDDTLFSDAISKYPYNTVAYYNRGIYYLSHKAEYVYINDPEQREKYINMSLSDFDNSLKYSFHLRNDLDIYTNLGIGKGRLGDAAGAIDAFNLALKIDPNHPPAYGNRGLAKASLKDYQGALADYNKAIELNPKDANTYLNRSIAKYEMTDYIGAIEDSDKAIELFNNLPKAFIVRGNAKFCLKNFESALEDYNKALELNPKDETAIKNIDLVKTKLEDSTK